MKDGISQTIGKRISGVIIAQNNREPRTQIFLTFEDDTYFEIYGNTFTGTNSIDKGSMEMLERHLSNINANVTHRLFTNGNYPPKPNDLQIKIANNQILTDQVIAQIDEHILKISWLNAEICHLANEGEDNSAFLAEYDEHIIELRQFGLCKKMMTTQEIRDDLIID